MPHGASLQAARGGLLIIWGKGVLKGGSCAAFLIYQIIFFSAEGKEIIGCDEVW
jgi:hypothetical protein